MVEDVLQNRQTIPGYALTNESTRQGAMRIFLLLNQMHCKKLKGKAKATYSGWEERAELELFEKHGACVGTKEQDEGHEGDVGDKVAGLAHQFPSILHTLLLGQR